MARRLLLGLLGLDASQLYGIGFRPTTARCLVRVTDQDVLQRIELRPNRHGGGEVACDLTIHPLWARDRLRLGVLEPGISLFRLCIHLGRESVHWYSSHGGGARMVSDILQFGVPWFDENASASSILESAKKLDEPWYNRQHTHVELGHCFLKFGQIDEARRVFDRKPSRVARYKTIVKWIEARDHASIKEMHDSRVRHNRAELGSLE